MPVMVQRVLPAAGPTNKLAFVSGASTPYVVMYVGSSTTEGLIGATDEHHNYVNHFSAMLLTSANDSMSTEKVIKINSGTATRPTTNGLWFYNCGLGGTTSADYIGANRQTLMSNLLPNLMIHMIGSNDYQSQMAPATYQSNIQSVINDARTRVPGVQHLLVHSYPRLDVTGNPTYKWEDYGARLDALAAANSDVQTINVQDLYAAQGVYLNSTDPNDLVYDGDNIHSTNAGYKFLAEAMAQKAYLNLRRGQKIYELDPDTLAGADNSAVASFPTAAGTLEQTAFSQATSGSRPLLKYNQVNGHRTVKFDGTDDQLSADLSHSYGLPMTMFVVIKPNVGGSATRPIFSRTTTNHKGYIYAFDQEINGTTSRLSAITNSPSSKYAFNMASGQYQVLGIVFRAADDQTIYVSDTYGKANETTSPDLTHGPFISSLRLGSNTGLNLWSPMDLAYMRLYQGELTQSEIEAELNSLGTRFGVTITYTPPVVYPEPATGPVSYSYTPGANDNQDLATIASWVDQAYSTGLMFAYFGRIVPNGMGNYRVGNCYLTPTTHGVTSKYHYARVVIHNVPAAAAAESGVGLVVRHSGSSGGQGVFCKVTTGGNWRIYAAPSNDINQTEPSYLASGTLPVALAPGDELIALVNLQEEVVFYLNNQELGRADCSSVAAGVRTGVIISQTNAGELRDFKTGNMTAQPAVPSYVEDTWYSSAATTAASVSATINLPPNRQVGDLMVLVVGNYSSTVATPTGWTAGSTKSTTSSTVPKVSLFRRFVDGTESSSLTFTIAKSTTSNSVSAHILLFRGGIDTVNPISPPSAVFSTSTSTTATAHTTGATITPSSTAAEAGRALVIRMARSTLAGAAPAAGTAYSWAAGATEVAERMGSVVNEPTESIAVDLISSMAAQAAITATHYTGRAFTATAFMVNGKKVLS